MANLVTTPPMWKYECLKCGHKHDYYAGCPICDPSIFEKPMTDAAELVKLADWIAHTVKVNEALVYVPEMAAHNANLRKWESSVRAIAAQQDGAWQPLPGEDLPDTYMRLRNGLDLKVAAEAASRNDDLCRIEGETDAEFVVRIVATYMAVSGHEQGSR